MKVKITADAQLKPAHPNGSREFESVSQEYVVQADSPDCVVRKMAQKFLPKLCAVLPDRLYSVQFTVEIE